ncbi:MAG: hypothetical protein ACTHKV_11650, partial [Flavipsychrobacter sp.]
MKQEFLRKQFNYGKVFESSRWFIMAICMVLLPALVKAQVPTTAAAYPFSSSIKTFNFLSSGTNVGTIQTDDAAYAGINIGFPFPFCTGVYTTVSVGSNGYLCFGNNNINTNYNNKGSGIEPGVFPLFDDISGSGGTATYLTQGTAPNRTFTMEWKNWKWNYSASSACISFQVILYEGGVIEFMYHLENGSVLNNSSGASIGIARNTNDFQTLPNAGIAPTPSSSTFTTNISSRPAEGQSYVWGILPCTGVPQFD